MSNIRDVLPSTQELDVNARIARRVGELRGARGLSLEALAERSGVSRSMLSLIERGESSPTAVLLERVASGLDVPLASLFESGQASTDAVSRARDQVSWRDPVSGYLRRNISPPNYPSPIKIVEVVMPAKARVAYKSNSLDSSWAQQIWVLQGTLVVSVGSATHRLESGDCLAMSLDATVAFHNPMGKVARYVVVIANDWGRVGKR